MVDTNRLRGIIAEQRISQRQLASSLGMAENAFRTKMKTGAFGTEEAERLSRLLGLEHPAEIFFAQTVT